MTDTNDSPDTQSQSTYTVTLTYPCKRALDESEDMVKSMALSLPMKSIKMAEYFIEHSSNIDKDASETLKDWLSAFNEANDKYVTGKTYTRTLEKQNGDWKQSVEKSDGQKIGILSAKAKTVNDGGLVSGDNALLLLNKALDMGTVVKIPLWHSGFWVSIKAPTAATLMSVDRVLSSEKIVLGRQTNGLIFSNNSVYLRRTLIELAMDCIVACSIKDYNKDKLLELIALSDYNTLLWGVICSIYPNGYRLIQPCVAGIDKCNFVSEELVMLSKLSWTDNNALNAEQKQFMAEQAMEKKSQSDIESYQENLSFSKQQIVDINDKLRVVLKVPSLKLDIDCGMRWIENIVEKVESTFADRTLSNDDKNLRIIEQAKASALRQYVAWVSEIHIKGDGIDPSIINDRFTIDKACNSLTNNDAVCKNLFEKIGEFIDNTTISLIGIPSYNCPNCEQPQTDDQSKHPEIIPLSIDDIFFTLIRQQTTKILTQEITF